MKLNKIMKIVVAMLLMALVAVVASQAASNVIGMIINIAQVIGMGVAIIMLVVLAIQYIAASPEGKAEIKKNATIYIVGAVILFAASGILGIIRRFAVNSIGTQSD